MCETHRVFSWWVLEDLAARGLPCCVQSLAVSAHVLFSIFSLSDLDHVSRYVTNIICVWAVSVQPFCTTHCSANLLKGHVLLTLLYECGGIQINTQKMKRAFKVCISIITILMQCICAVTTLKVIEKVNTSASLSLNKCLFSYLL